MPSRIIWNWPAVSSMPALSGGGVGEVVASGFQALAPQAQAVAAPVQDLEAVGGAVAEDEQVAGQGVGLEAGADQSEQAVEAQAHIDGLGAIPEFDGGGEAQHGWPPRGGDQGADQGEVTAGRQTQDGARRARRVRRRRRAVRSRTGQQTWSGIGEFGRLAWPP